MNDYLNILRNLVALSSENPAGDCVKIAKFVADYFKHYTKAKVYIQKITNGNINVIAKIGDPKFFINAHLDTIPATNGWQISPYKLNKCGTKLYGLGTTDVKGAIAATLFALKSSQPKNLLFLLNSDEEHGDNLGVKTFLKSRYAQNLKSGIVTEPTNLNVVTYHSGICNFEINFSGKSCHSAYPDKGINAIELAADFIQNLGQYKKIVSKYSFKGLRPTLNIAVIKGGVKSNIVPDNCLLKINYRQPPNFRIERMLKKIKYLAKGKNASIKITYETPPLNIKSKNNILITLLKSFGAKDNMPAVNFWSEAALFSKAGIPAVVFGPGDIAQAHSANEFINRTELEKAVEIYKRLFTKL